MKAQTHGQGHVPSHQKGYQASRPAADKEGISHTSKTGRRTLFFLPQAVYGLHCGTWWPSHKKAPDAEHTRGDLPHCCHKPLRALGSCTRLRQPLPANNTGDAANMPAYCATPQHLTFSPDPKPGHTAPAHVHNWLRNGGSRPVYGK